MLNFMSITLIIIKYYQKQKSKDGKLCWDEKNHMIISWLLIFLSSIPMCPSISSGEIVWGRLPIVLRCFGSIYFLENAWIFIFSIELWQSMSSFIICSLGKREGMSNSYLLIEE